MTKKICCAAFIIILLAGFPMPAAAETAAEIRDFGFDLEVSAQAAYFMNLDTDVVIYTKNPDMRVQPASTVKIMAAALAMTLCDDLDGTIVTVPDGVWNEFNGAEVSTADLRPGEQLTMTDLLHCILIQSANEGAAALADFFGRQNFINLMNQKALELGCTNTHFDNPHGYLGNNYTTARDMAAITRWALNVPGFWEITQKSLYEKAATNKHSEPVQLITTNHMQLQGSRYFTSYIKGVKTGTLEKRCLITTARKNGTTYLLVLYGAPLESDGRIWSDGVSTYTDARLCYDWAFDNLALKNVIDLSVAVEQVRLRRAAGRDTLLLYPDDELFALVRTDQKAEPLRYEIIELPEKVNAPVNSGECYGSAKVFYGDRYIGDIGLVAREDIKQNILVAILDTVSDILGSTIAMVIYAILLLVILFYLYYMLIVVPRARKKHSAARRKTGRR